MSIKEQHQQIMSKMLPEIVDEIEEYDVRMILKHILNLFNCDALYSSLDWKPSLEFSSLFPIRDDELVAEQIMSDYLLTT